MGVTLIKLPDVDAICIVRGASNSERWAEALEFCDAHGENGPDLLETNIRDARGTHDAGGVMYWTSIGRRLIEMHLAGSRDWH